MASQWYSGKGSASQCRRWQEMGFQSLVLEGALESAMEIRSSILARKEKPCGLQFMRSQRAGHN